jgi:hypothetical protein
VPETGGEVPDASTAVLHGSVQKSTFTGSLVTYTVACGDGVTVAAERHKPDPSDILPAGAPARLLIPRKSILAFDPKTGERV